MTKQMAAVSLVSSGPHMHASGSSCIAAITVRCDAVCPYLCILLFWAIVKSASFLRIFFRSLQALQAHQIILILTPSTKFYP